VTHTYPQCTGLPSFPFLLTPTVIGSGRTAEDMQQDVETELEAEASLGSVVVPASGTPAAGADGNEASGTALKVLSAALLALLPIAFIQERLLRMECCNRHSFK